MEPLKAPKGVIEYLPPESGEFAAVRSALLGAANRAGYGLIELPIFEDTALYSRGVGETTDVVSKEMYTFDDRGGRSLSLRPEGTAGVVRAAIEHHVDRRGLPAKLAYSGPFFRAERPQQGRYRQFSQVGVEALGSQDPALDAEVIAVAVEGFRELGLTQFRLLINSLGDSDTRERYRVALLEFFSGLDLDEATIERAQVNPLRVLDDKRPGVQAQLADAPVLIDFLSAESAEHHQRVLAYLDVLGIDYEPAPRLVRGLDYYTRTTFEFVHDGLGAQSAIGGGGRYDGLVEQLGGPALPGIGFGLGIDRTLLACRAEGLVIAGSSSCDVYVIPAQNAVAARAMGVAATLRQAGLRAEMAFDNRSMKSSMRPANKSGARIAVIVEAEPADTIMVKDLESSDQSMKSIDDAVIAIQEKLA